ncbi:MAG: ribokinase [Actinobacteria bacterium]|nr:ribokinase [Actinomycetota bacterium]MCG2819261.1 ribokinase [Actinomycetes bacterium]MBU4179043.1 ribokinase [Actinomycetota bacterium]MBU4218016.1 ribokinase [Actinomycetota bacterium]MBU4359361.1 ribokinase [Actinomycetota bacterium]
MPEPRITVMGSFVVDLMARTPHLPVTGETVKGYGFMVGPGGKGSNQGVAASRAGAEVDMVTKIGRDHFGQIALESFKSAGMHTRFVMTDEKLGTGAALIMVDDNTGDNKILVAPGACSNITEMDIEKARPAIEANAVFLTQLETNLDAIEKAIGIAADKGTKIILNPAPVSDVSDALLGLVDILTPNEVEASALSGVDIYGPSEATVAARALMRRGARNIIITLGALGLLAVTEAEERFIPSLKVAAVDTTGAGDAFNGALATAVAEGKGFFEAAEFANAAAALSVTRIGTARAMPERQDIDRAILQLEG